MTPYKRELQKMFDLQKFGMKFGLEGMRGILDKLGRPQQRLKLVHLAGTNGKGSVGVMLQSIMARAGYRAGLYTSPHLVTFRERIKIGGEMIAEDEVLALSARVWQATVPDSPPTFFEFVTALAMLYFEEKGVDLAVIETGLGGRLDSTNVIEAPLATAITNVTLEHTEHLGDTVAKIAAEKAGIIKPGVPVVCGKLVTEAEEVILARAGELGSPVIALGRDFKADIISTDAQGRPHINYRKGSFEIEMTVPLAGPHQADNAAVALTLALLLAERGFSITADDMRLGMAGADWPGRAETFPAGSWPPSGRKAQAPLLLDGAHNPAGALALAAMLKDFPRRRLHVIVGVMADKDIGGVLGPILSLADRIYLTRPLFSRAASPELLSEKIISALGLPKAPMTLHPGIPEAFRAAADEAGEGDLVLLSGSLFTVGEGRAYLSGIAEVESN